MAKLPDLVRAVARMTGEDDASVKVLARSLREGGLIKTGGRGRNGADMDWDDAASMVLGVASAAERTKAADDVSNLKSCSLIGGFVLLPEGHQALSADILKNTFTVFSSHLNSTLVKALEYYRLGDPMPDAFIPARFSFNAFHELRQPRSEDVGLKRETDQIVSSADVPVGEFPDLLPANCIALVTEQTPRSWNVTLAMKLGGGIDVFAFFERVRHGESVPVSWTTTTIIENAFIDGLVRCIRDEPPRQWSGNEG